MRKRDRVVAANSHSLARDLAAATIVQHDLQHFVRDWNAGGLTLISSWQLFDVALSFDKDLDAKVGEARTQAARAGYGFEFEEALRDLMEPSIRKSFWGGVRMICEAWAERVVMTDPVENGAPAPFHDMDAMAHWFFEAGGGPCLCGPYGEGVMSAPEEISAMAVALTRYSREARAKGWLSQQTLAFLN